MAIRFGRQSGTPIKFGSQNYESDVVLPPVSGDDDGISVFSSIMQNVLLDITFTLETTNNGNNFSKSN